MAPPNPASQAAAPSQAPQRRGRLRGVNNADTARRLQIKFPADITMKPGDRVYGIDATRSSLVSSYSSQHYGEVVAGNLGRGQRAAPVIINPLNDAYLANARGLPELAAEWRKGFKPEANEHSAALAAMPEVQEQIGLAKKAGAAARKDDEMRRKTFGVLSKAGINFAHQRGTQIFYGLDDMSVANAFNPDAEHYPTVSSQEIRHIHANLGALAPLDAPTDDNTVRFIRGGQEVAPAAVFRGVDASKAQRRPSYGQLRIDPPRGRRAPPNSPVASPRAASAMPEPDSAMPHLEI